MQRLIVTKTLRLVDLRRARTLALQRIVAFERTVQVSGVGYRENRVDIDRSPALQGVTCDAFNHVNKLLALFWQDKEQAPAPHVAPSAFHQVGPNLGDSRPSLFELAACGRFQAEKHAIRSRRRS